MGQRKLKTPQERSDEEAEAEPTEREVAGPVGGMHRYSFCKDFVYSLNRPRPVLFHFYFFQFSDFI